MTEDAHLPPEPGAEAQARKPPVKPLIFAAILGLLALITFLVKPSQDDKPEGQKAEGSGTPIATANRPFEPGGASLSRGPDQGSAEQEHIQSQILRRLEDLELFAASELLRREEAQSSQVQERDQRRSSALRLGNAVALGSSGPSDLAGLAPPNPVSDTLRESLASLGLGREEPDRSLLSERLIEGSSRVDVAYEVPVHNTLRSGTVIQAVLETALDSNVPGLARAKVTRPVRSFDGQNILVPAHTRLVGEFAATSSQGEARVFLTWQKIIRPDGHEVQILAPSTDALGRSGIGGDVDTRFWQRFGGAMLVGIVDEAATFARSDDSLQVLGGGQSPAQSALSASFNLPPRITVPAGTVVNVMVRDTIVLPE